VKRVGITPVDLIRDHFAGTNVIRLRFISYTGGYWVEWLWIRENAFLVLGLHDEVA